MLLIALALLSSIAFAIVSEEATVASEEYDGGFVMHKDLLCQKCANQDEAKAELPQDLWTVFEAKCGEITCEAALAEEGERAEREEREAALAEEGERAEREERVGYSDAEWNEMIKIEKPMYEKLGYPEFGWDLQHSFGYGSGLKPVWLNIKHEGKARTDCEWYGRSPVCGSGHCAAHGLAKYDEQWIIADDYFEPRVENGLKKKAGSKYWNTFGKSCWWSGKKEWCCSPKFGDISVHGNKYHATWPQDYNTEPLPNFSRNPRTSGETGETATIAMEQQSLPASAAQEPILNTFALAGVAVLLYGAFKHYTAKHQQGGPSHSVCTEEF